MLRFLIIILSSLSLVGFNYPDKSSTTPFDQFSQEFLSEQQFEQYLNHHDFVENFSLDSFYYHHNGINKMADVYCNTMYKDSVVYSKPGSVTMNWNHPIVIEFDSLISTQRLALYKSRLDYSIFNDYFITTSQLQVDLIEGNIGLHEAKVIFYVVNSVCLGTIIKEEKCQ